AANQVLHFPEGDEIIFMFATGDQASYKILNAELSDLGGGVHLISFLIRCTIKNDYGANFWDDTFRLELDKSGVLLTPSSGLNELIPANSSKDGTVSFEVKE